VLAAGAAESSAARTALSTLCETYWYPLYAYIRRRGADADAARDLTQSFLASLLERRSFDHLDPSRGRFRAFPLASLQHFLANDAARRHAQKRGGQFAVVRLEIDGAEGRYAIEPSDPITPERLYERRWALTVIERVLARLRSEWSRAGRAEEFDALKSSLLFDAAPGHSAAVARQLSTTEGAVRTAVHRLRQRFREELRRDIAATVSSDREIDDELRYLVRRRLGPG
jgi:RNA polymerase sigma-70 factor (ECF subfamily)